MTTVAITDYTSLSQAIKDFTERDYDAGQIDRFIDLAEADFRLYFGPNYAVETVSTPLTFASGSAALPAGFVRPIALIHSTAGSVAEQSISTVRATRVFNTSGNPTIYAITGTTVETSPPYSGDLSLQYEGSLPALSSGNATNWLVTNAPQAYLAMCLYYAKAFEEDQTAPAYKANAMQMLNDLSVQSTVAKYGRGSLVIAGATP